MEIGNLMIDPELKPFLDQAETASITDAASLEIARRWGSIPPPPLAPPAPQPKAEWIDTPAGRLKVIVIEPADGSVESPVVLHFHLGGYILGTPELRVPVLHEAVVRTRAAIVSVDYRLAPEHPAPAALEDALSAHAWMKSVAAARGWDPNRVALMGESSGGGLAVALALRLRDADEQIAQQILIYPMLDDRTAAADGEVGKYLWNAESNAFAWRSYLGRRTEDGAAGWVAARAKKLQGLPPTWIGVGAADLFAREDVAFAERLRQAEVPVELHVSPGAYHGFDQFVPAALASRRFQASWISALSTALTR